MCICVFLHMCMYKPEEDLLDLEWQKCGSHHIGDEKSTQVLWRNSKRSYLMSHLSSLYLQM